jgi:IMP dehydrogenase
MKQFLEGLSFDDVLLKPRFSKIHPEEINFKTNLTKNITLKNPLVSSPMDTVTEKKLALVMAQEGGIGIIHRNLTVSEQINQVITVKKGKVFKNKSSVDKKGRLLVGAAIGVGPDMEKRLKALIKAEADTVVLDSAHGHSYYISQATRKIVKKYPKLELIAGNVASAQATLALINAGAKAIRAGIGPGSICTTRIISGVGMPQLTAILDCVEIANKYKVPVIADGGIKYSGDIVKALAAGASTVMMGSLLAQTKEAPGKVITIGEKKYKYYRGMGSEAAMKKGSAARYGQSTRGVAGKFVAEGVEGLVPYKGTLKDFIFQMLGGVRAGMVYLGAKAINQIHEKAKFIKISPASLAESHPHSISITNGGSNYERK